MGEARPHAPLYLEVNLEEAHRPYADGGAKPTIEQGIIVPAYLPAGPGAEEEMALFQGAVNNADRAVGRILDALEATDLAENTLVLFCADHGIAMPRAKCTLYDPGIAIACLIRWPSEGIAAGRVIPSLLSNIDIAPTLLVAAGITAPGAMQGQAFLDALRGKAYQPRRKIHAEKTFHSYYDPMRAVRDDRFKYIRNFSSAFAVEVPGDVQEGAIFREHVMLYHGAQHPAVELYDLQVDPWEQHNLAGTPAIAEEERQLDAQLWRWMAETVDPLLNGPIPSPAYQRALAERARARP